MSTAVTNFGKAYSGYRIKPVNCKKAVGYIKTESKKARVLKAAKKTFFYGLILSLGLAIAATAAFFYYYNQYSVIVDRRIASGFWHSRAGVYSAPFVLRKDQKTSLENVVELLRRSGYVEGDSAEEIWNGNFIARGDRIEINTKNYASGQVESATLELRNNRIAAISDGKKSLNEYRIEPELLTGRTEMKRGKNHVLKYEDIPENLRNAILTAEDRRFFEHHGIDPQGIFRAIFANYQKGAIRQGGSTITQQLVKNTFLSPERSFSRKFSEAFLSLALEKRMSKQEIFALYCNEIYLGQYGLTGIHGVEQAARAYFDKDLKDLSLQESAAIAAMIKNPTHFAPHKNAAEAKVRRQWIISKMAELNLVSAQDAEIAQNTELKLAKPKTNNQSVAPYFVDSATKEINEKFSTDYLNTNFNNRIYTTIDTQLQNLAEQAVARQLAALDKVYVKKGKRLQATIVAIDPQNGHILAMVGGRDYKESQFNRAPEAMRQPGSTFKPFVYAAAFERGMMPVTVYADAPTEFQFYNRKNYKPANYGDSYSMKNISLKTALAKSSNVIAVKTSVDAGLYNVANKAKEFGFENVEPYPSMALGTEEVTPLQLAAAYCIFANGGRRVEPTFIDKIVSVEDETVYTSMQSDKRVVSARTAYMITDMLEAVVTRGTARKAAGALGKDVVFAGKTGSSKDGWFVGYTPNLVTVAWIGLDENEDIGATGGEVALPLWVDFMKSVVQTRPEFGGENFPMPKGLMEVTIDPETGMLADTYCPQSEKVVVPSGAVSGIKCLKHQPQPEYLEASNNPPQTDSSQNETDAAPDVNENTGDESENETGNTDVNGIPTQKVEKTPREPKKREIDKTYIEDFEARKIKSRLDNK
ncbi:MAG TPA: PBP1A family penicillin-binding protein [Pyrinomonadaceae bacterium]|jgi:penicillin-binding protein 1B